MRCSTMKVKTHWTNVGYNAAKRGVAFDEIRLPGEKIANEWIREGMQKWLRKATRLGMNREAGR